MPATPPPPPPEPHPSEGAGADVEPGSVAPCEGRLRITCIAGRGLKKPGTRQPKTLSINPYLRFSVGGRENALRERSAVVKKSNKNPDFHQSEVKFDVTDPAALHASQVKDLASTAAKLGLSGATAEASPLLLHVALYSDSSFSDALLGECDIDLTPLFAGKQLTQWFDLTLPAEVAAGREKAGKSDGPSASAAGLEGEERTDMGQVRR